MLWNTIHLTSSFIVPVLMSWQEPCDPGFVLVIVVDVIVVVIGEHCKCPMSWETIVSVDQLIINRTISRKPKSFESCRHMNCCLQKYTTHQFTYFIYYLFQDKFKNPKIIKIQQVHQKIHTKQFLIFYIYCFLLATHLNLKRLDKRD